MIIIVVIIVIVISISIVISVTYSTCAKDGYRAFASSRAPLWHPHRCLHRFDFPEFGDVVFEDVVFDDNSLGDPILGKISV